MYKVCVISNSMGHVSVMWMVTKTPWQSVKRSIWEQCRESRQQEKIALSLRSEWWIALRKFISMLLFAGTGEGRIVLTSVYTQVDRLFCTLWLATRTRDSKLLIIPERSCHRLARVFVHLLESKMTFVGLQFTCVIYTSTIIQLGEYLPLK